MTESRRQDQAKPAGPTAGDGGVRQRKPYRTPELVEYGPVAKLTQGTLSRNSDFFSGGFRMRNNMGMCL